MPCVNIVSRKAENQSRSQSRKQSEARTFSGFNDAAPVRRDANLLRAGQNGPVASCWLGHHRLAHGVPEVPAVALVAAIVEHQSHGGRRFPANVGALGCVKTLNLNNLHRVW